MASSFTNSRTSTTQIITLPVIPELFDSDYLDVLLPTKTSEDVMLVDRSDSSTPTPTNPMIEALKEFATRTYTENMAKAYNSTGSPVLDAFQLISDCSSSSDIAFHLSEAWKEDPSLTLIIIWNIRSIHDGKGEKELFYRAFGWLYDNHPRTAISNLHLLVEPACAPPKKKKHDVEGSSHGYWKDLLNILCLATRGELHDENPAFLHNQRPLWTYPKDMQPIFRPLRLNNTHGFSSGSPEKYKAWRAEQRSATYERLVRRLLDPTYRALYITVVRLFAERLEKDFKLLEELEALPSNGNRLPLLKKISLAGKWAPSPGGSHDRVCNISTAIAKLMRSSQVFRPLPTVLSAPLDPRAEALVLRSVFQRWVLTELRKAIQCPEPLMSANRWSEIKYSRVPSICMNNKTELFFKHDPEGFQKYLILVESGKLRISGATLMPHELVKKVVELANPEVSRYSMLDEFKRDLWETQSRVVEGQWKTLIERLKEFGSLENSIAICDVSGSMGSLSGSIGSLFCKSRFGKRRAQPIFPAIALSLVLAHLAKPPFNAGFITFSSNPEFIQLDLSRSLYDTVVTMSRANWEMNTDFNAVFMKLLLPLAIKNGVKQEDMIKRLFVFSDMQFDQASSGYAYRPFAWTPDPSPSWETNYDVIEKAYKEAGYEVPEIVYWDLSSDSFRRTVEVKSDRKGVAMMNGFSPAMLKVFMGEEEEWENVAGDGSGETVSGEEDFTPENVMRKALGKESFAGLVVVD